MNKRGEQTSQPRKPQKKPLQVLLDEDVLRVLKMRCAQDGKRLTDVAAMAIREWLKQQPPMRALPTL